MGSRSIASIPARPSTERTPSLLAARAGQLGVSPEEAERQDFAPDSPRGNAICRMVDASEVAFGAAFLASEKSLGDLRRAGGGKWRGWAVSVLLSRETGAEVGVSVGPAGLRRGGQAAHLTCSPQSPPVQILDHAPEL
jgi:hypothetical protein